MDVERLGFEAINRMMADRSYWKVRAVVKGQVIWLGECCDTPKQAIKAARNTLEVYGFQPEGLLGSPVGCTSSEAFQARRAAHFQLTEMTKL